ncbi:MAG: flagellar motor switch protein FliG [Spirochaetia bacterium]|nr:flagellar motor switch protein FliG [Spirochaetia bacterium]
MEQNQKRNPEFKSGEQIDFIITDEGIEKKNPLPAQISKRPPNPTNLSEKGTIRAAKLLLALGPDQSAEILKEMSENEVESLVREMLTIQSISPEEKKQILDEFRQGVDHFEPIISGGMNTTREILIKGLGDTKAEEILSKLNRNNLKHDFEFLEQIDPPALAAALSFEHPQTTAVALSFIQPRIAASVLKHFPDDIRSQVALRIAKTSRTHPDAVQSIARVLREKFEKRKDEFFSEIGGAEALANILNHMDRGMEDDILNILGDDSPEILDDVKDMLYTFEELTSLSQKEMRLLLSRINDDMMIASALRGAGDELRRHFFNSISQNRAADILDEIDRRGPLSLREINEARSYIVNIARRIDEEGAIVIKKQKEEYL